MMLEFPLASKVAVAFRGYNVTNAGRTAELFDCPLINPHLTSRLKQAENFYAELMNEKHNFSEIVRLQRPSTLETYAVDLSIIVAVELAQWDTLVELLGDQANQIEVVMGYSLGEVTATIIAGLFSYEDAMKPILTLAGDAAELAEDVTMGILFSRGAGLDYDFVNRHCAEITSQGEGVIAISTYLSPNTVLLMGQGKTVDLFKETMRETLPKSVHLRKNPNHWPPLHTPIVLQKHLRDRAALILQTTPCTLKQPDYPVLSCVTGNVTQQEMSSRQIMIDWIDHPQLLWDCVHTMLEMGIEQVLHLGPEPNIIPATLTRLAENVQAQMDKPNWVGYGLRTFSRWAAHRTWLTGMITKDAVLLRAPHIEQIIFEDWLLQTETEQNS